MVSRSWKCYLPAHAHNQNTDGRSSEQKKLGRGLPDDDMEVHVQLAAPEAPDSAPSGGGKARAVDAVQHSGYRPSGQRMLVPVQVDELPDVRDQL